MPKILKRMHVVFLCHDASKVLEDLEGKEYNVRCPNIRPKSYDFFCERVDAIFFIKMDKTKASVAQSRSIRTVGAKHLVAKNRWNLKPLYSFNNPKQVTNIMLDIKKFFQPPKKKEEEAKVKPKEVKNG